MLIHHCTSVYMVSNEVIPRLGTNMEVHISSILLTYSAKYYKINLWVIPITIEHQTSPPNDRNNSPRAVLCKPDRGTRHRNRTQSLSPRSLALFSSADR